MLCRTAAEAALPDHPHVVMIGDRESDFYDLFAMPRDSRTDLLVRIRDRRRRVEHPAKYLGEAPEKPVKLWFLSAREENPPPGQSPIDWLLGSTLPIRCLEDALHD